MRRFLRHVVIILAVASVVTGCCSVCRYRWKHSLPLEGTEWHLVKLGGESLSLDGGTFNMRLADGVVTIGMGCNSVSGRYSFDRNLLRLHMDLDVATLASCPEYERIERKLVTSLGLVTHYDIDYDMLMVIGDGAIKAVFRSSSEDDKSGRH